MKEVPIVDNEKPASDTIEFNLTKEGYETVTTFDGRKTITKLEERDPDLIILDLMLPELDRLEVIKEVRKTGHIPIIMLSARDSESDKVIGLEIDADDYVTKPFSNRGLLARVKAHLRYTGNIETAIAEESASASNPEITIGDLKTLPGVFMAQKRGEDIELAHREFELPHHLATHMGQVMTCEHLLEIVWGYDYLGGVRTVDVAIRRSCRKIEDTLSRPKYILARRSVGYYMRSYK